MLIEIDSKDIENLHYTSMGSFYETQKDRFELEKGDIKDIEKDGTFMWYNAFNKIDALISYQYYFKKYKCVLLYDTAENPDTQWCIYINKKWS